MMNNDNLINNLHVDDNTKSNFKQVDGIMLYFLSFTHVKELWQEKVQDGKVETPELNLNWTHLCINMQVFL